MVNETLQQAGAALQTACCPIIGEPEMTIYCIIKEKCSACGLCADTCPVEAISQIGVYEIDPDVCNGCGACLEDCPSGAVECIDVKPA